MKFLGQHFLKNVGVIKKIVVAIDPQPGDTIIEVGPGHGELTLSLAKQGASTTDSAPNAHIIAVEKDKKLVPILQANIKNAGVANVEIVEGDIFEFLKNYEAAENVAEKNLRGPLKIVGNIPYYLTGHLLRVVGELASPQLVRCVFMIQKEVAERMCAKPPRMNRLAASVQFWAKTTIVARVSREDFSPPPEVDSAVVALETKPTSDLLSADLYYAAVRQLFAQPRKTILNNLASKAADKENIKKYLQTLNLDPELRPQDLTVENIAQIARFFASVHK